jgi:hypothetical protein
MIKSTKSANESLQLDSAFRLKQSPRLIARKNEGKLTDPTAIKALYSQHIADSSASQFLISGEVLDSFDTESLSRLICFFERLDLDVFLVGYFRSLASVVPSVFQQRLKAHADFVHSRETLPAMIRHCIPAYPGLVKRLRKCISSDRLRLFAFDPPSFPSCDVVSDFCCRLGINISETALPMVNTSLSLIAVKVLWIGSLLSNNTAFPDLLRRKLIMQLSKEFNHLPRFQIHPELIGRVVPEMEQSFAWIDEHLEKHRPFSLLDISCLDGINYANAIRSLRQLAVLEDCEKECLVKALFARGVSVKGDCSSNELVSSYWDAVAARMRLS